MRFFVFVYGGVGADLFKVQCKNGPVSRGGFVDVLAVALLELMLPAK